ncbi:MAG: hypothetical protein KJ749_04695 [Planctomycetes bacterium]|nr:hypothetical protein [Planctomycetota bacterium]
MDQQQFLETVVHLVESNYPRDPRRGLKAAEVGLLVHRALPDLDWNSLGFSKLSDVLDVLEDREIIQTGPDDKRALTVWLRDREGAGIPATPRAFPPRGEIVGAVTIFRPLRNDVWTAFVAALPQGRRFLRQSDGVVRMGLDDAPQPEQEWVEIEPIAEDRQKEWAVEFLRESRLDKYPELALALDAPDWYRVFPEKLRADARVEPSRWNRLRSNRILQRVREWAEQKKVSPEVIFSPACARTLPARLVSRPDEHDLKRRLLDAVGQMTVNELLEVRIPARYVLQVFRPDLLGLPREAVERDE